MLKSKYLAALLVVLIPFSANAITLDELNKPTNPDPIQVAEALNPPTSDVNVRSSDTAIGGTRTLKVDVTQGNPGVGIRSRVTGQTPGKLIHSQDSGVKGITTITWDGDSDPNSLKANGLGGVDFTGDSGTEIRIKVLEDADVGNGSLVRFTMVVYDNAAPGGDKFSVLTKELTQDVPLGSFELIKFPFADFVQGGTAVGPADFQNVGAVRLFIDGSQSTAVDLNIGPVVTDGECTHVPVNGLIKDDCGVCNGNNQDKGCDGVCFSNKVFDDCQVCDGGNRDKGCDLVCFSGKVLDECEVCDGNNSTCAGCDGIPNSGTTFDACGVCDGNSQSCQGCDGIPNSGKTFDACGVCGGNGTSCADCLGVPYGTAKLDKCGVCNGSNACLDCAGSPNGTATLDACGVCQGNGQSCISCESQDVRPLSFVLDAGAKDQERLIKNVLIRLLKAEPTSANEAYAAKARVVAHDTQVRNWNLSWSLPPFEKQCSPAELCITASNEPIISEYRVNSEKLRRLSLQALAKLRRAEGSTSRFYTKMAKRANQFHAINLDNANKVPKEFQTSCG